MTLVTKQGHSFKIKEINLNVCCKSQTLILSQVPLQNSTFNRQFAHLSTANTYETGTCNGYWSGCKLLSDILFLSLDSKYFVASRTNWARVKSCRVDSMSDHNQGLSGSKDGSFILITQSLALVFLLHVRLLTLSRGPIARFMVRSTWSDYLEALGLHWRTNKPVDETFITLLHIAVLSFTQSFIWHFIWLKVWVHDSFPLHSSLIFQSRIIARPHNIRQLKVSAPFRLVFSTKLESRVLFGTRYRTRFFYEIFTQYAVMVESIELSKTVLEHPNTTPSRVPSTIILTSMFHCETLTTRKH